MALVRRGVCVLAGAALFAAGGLLLALAGESEPEKPKARPARQPAVRKPTGPRIAGIWAKLDLTDEQKQKYAELDKDRAAKVKEVQDKIKALQAEIKAATKAFEDGMTAVLTEEQAAKMKQIQDEENQKREEERKKREEERAKRMKEQEGTKKEPKEPKPAPVPPPSDQPGGGDQD